MIPTEGLQEFLHASWAITTSMAPWLLLGFALAGVLSVLVPTRLIQKHLAGSSIYTVFKAVLFGIPLPLCSCGVIPVAATLRKSGASKGAVAAFTASTPQTGVDSIATTYSLMGLPFTLGRIVADVLSGLLAGFAINLLGGRRESNDGNPSRDSCCGSCDSDDTASAESECGNVDKTGRFRAILRNGFIDLPGDIGLYVIIGILLGALLVVAIPQNLVEQYGGENPWVIYSLVTVISIPVYVCATGSIPVAFGLIAAGISPGAAIVFLVTGPATNSATVVTLIKLIGKVPTAVYVGSLIIGAWSVGFAFDHFGIVPVETITGAISEPGFFGSLAAILLLLIFFNALRPRKK